MSKTNSKTLLLLKNGYIPANNTGGEPCSKESLVTVLVNFMYYGYVPSKDLKESLEKYSEENLINFWEKIESVFKEHSFMNRNMTNYMVYKNFPSEVLNMSQAEYWLKQIFIYLGADYDLVREEESERPVLQDAKNLKVLSLEKEDTLGNIYKKLVIKSSKWNDGDSEDYLYLFNLLKPNLINVSDFGFKMNAIFAAKIAYENGVELNIKDATDVLRLAAALSEGDASLKTKTKFKNFTRKERKVILGLLENSKNLENDMGLRKEVWKKFMFKLHAGDFSFKRVKEAMNLLYNNEIKTKDSVIEKKMTDKDASVFNLLISNHGLFVRRFHKLYEIYGEIAIDNFKKVIKDLNTLQILKFKKYIETINERKTLIIAPKGNWTKALIQKRDEDFNKVKINEKDLEVLLTSLNEELSSRLKNHFKNGINLDENLKNVKLEVNDQSLALGYGRGTKFDIPKDVKFIRTASYWEVGEDKTIWFDNGFNFFNSNWNGLGAICWNSEFSGAAFSGDPMSGSNEKGRACQVIDLDIEKLIKNKVRYCVWNILSYNNVSFNSVNEILGTLQFAEDNLSGAVYEPSRAQINFQLKGENKTKYVACIDLQERKVIYLDCNLNGTTQSAAGNIRNLEEKLPAFFEYMETLPSVFDLFENAPVGDVEFRYSDKDYEIKNEKAYVFIRNNENNNFDNIDISEYLKT